MSRERHSLLGSGGSSGILRVVVVIPGPMLATSGRPAGSLAGWTAEVKADGFRCQVAAIGGRRVIRTRGGHDIADQLPELEALSHLGVDVILDGELVAGAGRPADFYAVIGSVSSRRRDRTQLNFLAFDLLWLDGSWLVDDPQTDRRRLLERLHQLSDGTLGVLASFPAADLDDLLAGCEDLDLEGVVLKRSGSRYRPGRSRDWRTMCSRQLCCLRRHRRRDPISQQLVDVSPSAVRHRRSVTNPPASSDPDPVHRSTYSPWTSQP